MPLGQPLIAARSASFGYADRVVVDHATFTLTSGDVVALLGPNGSGKSTLVRGILGLVPLRAGSLELFGMPRADFTDHTRLGYVPQRHSLSSSVRSTVTEIVATGRLPHRPWWKPATSRDRALVSAAIEAVGLADRAHHEVSTLSGGQQRRVLIARALAGQPDVLVMDEPTAGVDFASQEVLADVLDRLAHEGTSMLIVTHELDALAPVVNRIVTLDGGHIAFDGSPLEYHELSTLDRRGDSGRHHCADQQRNPMSTVLGHDPAPTPLATDGSR